MADYTVDFINGTAICGTCGREFNMHHAVKKVFRRQLGRRWVCNLNNIERHVRACQKKQSSLREEYLKLHYEGSPYPGSAGTFQVLDELRKRLNMRARTFTELVTCSVEVGRARLAKAPGAFRSRRYQIRGEEWIFIAMPVGNEKYPWAK